MLAALCLMAVAPARLAAGVAGLMPEGGRILNLSTRSAQETFPGLGLYCMSKHALRSVSQSLQMELAPGIAVAELSHSGLCARSCRAAAKTSSSSALGQGGGLRGLPGDYTPPSRFVRAAALVLLIDEPADAASAESACLHVINSFDIPAGLITEEFKPGQVVDEVTSWVTVCNLTDRRYGYRTIADPVPYVVDLTTTDFSTSRRMPVPGAARFTPVTV